MRKTLLACPLFLAAVLPSAASADITYSVDRAVTAAMADFGPGASVVGTLTTDGALGAITQSNIVDWSLVLSVGGQQVSMTTGNSLLEYVPSSHAGLFASITSLEFVFAPPSPLGDSFLAFFGGTTFGTSPAGVGPDKFAWCIGTNYCGNDLGEPDEMFLISMAPDEYRTIVEHDPVVQQVVGTATPVTPQPTSVPLPGSIGFLAVIGAFLGIGMANQRRVRIPKA